MDKNQDADVTVFNEEVSSHHRRHTSDSVVWGVFLIFAGSVLFLNSFRILPWEAWNEILLYWPILLILGGLHLVIGNNLLSRLIMMLVSVLLMGLVFVSVVRRHVPNIVTGLPQETVTWVNYFDALTKRP